MAGTLYPQSCIHPIQQSELYSTIYGAYIYMQFFLINKHHKLYYTIHFVELGGCRIVDTECQPCIMLFTNICTVSWHPLTPTLFKSQLYTEKQIKKSVFHNRETAHTPTQPTPI